MKKYGRVWRDLTAGELDDDDPQKLLVFGDDDIWISQDASLLILVSESVVYVSDI
jgi:hypothetical protein